MKILIAGCGDLGTALGVRLKDHEVWGLRRSPENLPAPIQPIAADLTDPATLKLPDVDVAFFTAGADGKEDGAYKAIYLDGLRNLIDKLKVRRLFFASSTAVYAQEEGEWVDEDSPANPLRFNGVRMLEAEDLVRAAPFPSTIVRFGGLYKKEAKRTEEGRLVWLNRIHIEDAAGFFAHLLTLESPDKLYLGVDGKPVQARRNRATSKRCRNDRMLATGYKFLHRI